MLRVVQKYTANSILFVPSIGELNSVFNELFTIKYDMNLGIRKLAYTDHEFI